MGRARGNTPAIAMAGFDAALGTRRGAEQGDVLAPNPSAADRLELERMASGVDRGQLEEAIELLLAHWREIDRLPLLAELHERVCKRLVHMGKRRFAEGSARALRAFGFEPEFDRGQLLYTEELQGKLDSALVALAQQRTRNLFKVGQRPSEDVVAQAAYMTEFCRYAGAQLFQNRERLCQQFLGGPLPPNLRDVTAWRELIKRIVEREDADISREGVAKMLRAAHSTLKRQEAAPRRRQRYVR